MLDDNDLVYLGLEMQMAMRVQAMGRDQDELIGKMRALPQVLVIEYFNTDYILRINNQEIVLKITGDVPPALKSLKQSWAIITAYNPYSAKYTDSENRASQERLTRELSHQGYETLPATGRSSEGSWEEESILVLGISYKKAKALGSAFQQNAIVFGEVNGPIELVFCNSE